MQPRRATPQDAARIHAVLAAAFAPLRARYTPAAYEATVVSEARLVARHAEGPAWLAGDVGTVGAVLRADGVYLRSMAVHPAARGQGIGGALMDAVEAFAQESGARRIFLSTTPFLHAAIRLYERHGFVRTPAPPHDLHGTPLFTMEKRLNVPPRPLGFQ